MKIDWNLELETAKRTKDFHLAEALKYDGVISFVNYAIKKDAEPEAPAPPAEPPKEETPPNP